ncbi:unnamed protein product [Absidia cylindrospora]
MLESIADRILKDKNFNDKYALAGVLTTAIAIGAVYIMQRQGAATKDAHIPLVPYVLPIFGSTLSYRKDENKFAKETALKYGPVYRAHLFGKVVTIVGAGHAEEIFTHPQMSFSISQRKKFDAVHFFLIYPYKISKTAVQDSIIKELNPRLKHYSPRAYMEFKNVMGEMLGESHEEPAHLTTLAPVVLRCISQACLAVFLGPDACKSTDLASTFSEMLHALSGEFELNLWHQVFPWYHQKYMEIYYPIMKKMKKHRATIKSVIKKELDRRLSQNVKSDDLLQYIIESASLENNHETVESLTTYIVIMFFVGVLTTFGSTIGIIKLITEDDSMMKDLKEEQEQAIDDEMLAQNITDATAIDRDAFLTKNIAQIYRRMAKLDSFIREFFRYGTRNVAHAHTNVGNEDIILKSGAVIHPGDEVYINLWDVHQQSMKQNIDDDKSMDEFQAFRHVGQQTPSTKVGGDFLLFGMGK